VKYIDINAEQIIGSPQRSTDYQQNNRQSIPDTKETEKV
jgi:hypothetical protein